ncbi:hypothetical protein IW492_05505 [Enterococcus sp. BWB1-3]|nr:hypothetical protein [Enterococcus sp. BWT-B8]MBL1228688.1 hypothetical protein [Enterococcus sp. BWB1-3]MCB5952760.1 hypothetical protein [Enterococcus sp. BWT-B8]
MKKKSFILLIFLTCIISGCTKQQDQSLKKKLVNENDTNEIKLAYEIQDENTILPVITNNSDYTIQFDPNNYTVEILENKKWVTAHNNYTGKSSLGLTIDIPANTSYSSKTKIDISYLDKNENYRLHYKFYKERIPKTDPINIYCTI